MNAGSPPSPDASSWFALYSLTSWTLGRTCGPGKSTEQNFACTLDPFGFALDQWIDSVLATHGTVKPANTIDRLGWALTFEVNATWTASTTTTAHSIGPHTNIFTDYVWWVPSRQIISNLSVDINTIANIASGNELSTLRDIYTSYDLYHDDLGTYFEYNKSLELIVQRNGPMIGFVPVMWADSDAVKQWTLNVGEEQLIRCYERYDLAKVPFAPCYARDYYTKCIRLGQGWSKDNKNVSFVVPGDSKAQSAEISVDIYSSDCAAFFHNGHLPAWLPSKCLVNETADDPGCDWERFFTTGTKSPLVNRTRNVITTEMKMSNGIASVTWAVNFVAFLGFTTYSLDTSRISNPSFLVRTRGLPTSGSSVTIDPSRALAGWSVNNGGVLSTQRTSASMVQQVMGDLLKYQRLDANLETRMKTHTLGFIPIAHTLSLIDHRLTTMPQSSWPSEQHLLLQRNARMYVWDYFMGSRTSTLGVVVAIGGAVVVLLQAYYGFVDRRPYYDSIDTLAAALLHMPQGEFDDKADDEKAVARMRFRVEDSDGQVTYLPQ